MSGYEDVATEIDDRLSTPNLKEVVAAYFDPKGPFAGATFDTLDRGPVNRFTEGDLLAATLLDVRVKPRAMRQILEEDAAELSTLLTRLPASRPLWQATDDNLADAAAMWNRLRKYDGIDWVIAGKLLARKRPRLIPVVDSVIVRVLKPPKGEVWASLRATLGDADRRRRIEDLRPATAAGVSTLRLLDVSLWMLGSQSQNAKKVRSEFKTEAHHR